MLAIFQRQLRGEFPFRCCLPFPEAFFENYRHLLGEPNANARVDDLRFTITHLRASREASTARTRLGGEGKFEENPKL